MNSCDEQHSGQGRLTQGSPWPSSARPEPRDYVYLTHDQVLTLATEARPWRLLILLLAYTGLRWGEATALRVCDIDFERRRIDVRRAFSDVGGHIFLGTPKSHQSRTVPIPRFLTVALATAATGKHADEAVFTMRSGTVVRLFNWRRAVFQPARTWAGVSVPASAFTTCGTPPRHG